MLAQPNTFRSFDGFIVAVKQAFGVEANNITALCQKALDELRWSSDVPVFFADFDRITCQLGIVDHSYSKSRRLDPQLCTENSAHAKPRTLHLFGGLGHRPKLLRIPCIHRPVNHTGKETCK